MTDPMVSRRRQVYDADPVTPAQAGVQDPIEAVWIPACAGMTTGSAFSSGSQAGLTFVIQRGTT